MDELRAFELCPLDGRYSDIKEMLSPYFSEYAYIKYRVFVEIEWLKFLIENNFVECNNNDLNKIQDIYLKFNIDSYKEIKYEESITNHDVKAIEYFIGNKLRASNLTDLVSFVHIGLTSEDINNTAYALMIKEYLNEVYFPKLEEFTNYLEELSNKYKETAFLAHTHGQPATPTTVGKEFKVYNYK